MMCIPSEFRVQDFEINAGEIEASAVIRPDVDDLSRKEEGEHFNQLKNDLLQFIRGFQWGVWARGLILQWKNLNETLCALSGYSGDGFPQGPDGEDRAGHL